MRCRPRRSSPAEPGLAARLEAMITDVLRGQPAINGYASLFSESP
jgi:hypothetical protein